MTTRQLSPRGRPKPLSPREQTVLALLGEGLTNAEIAASLNIGRSDREAARLLDHVEARRAHAQRSRPGSEQAGRTVLPDRGTEFRLNGRGLDPRHIPCLPHERLPSTVDCASACPVRREFALGSEGESKRSRTRKAALSITSETRASGSGFAFSPDALKADLLRTDNARERRACSACRSSAEVTPPGPGSCPSGQAGFLQLPTVIRGRFGRTGFWESFSTTRSELTLHSGNAHRRIRHILHQPGLHGVGRVL